MGVYRHPSLASHLNVVVTGIATQQSRHFRTVLGGASRELAAAVRAAVQAVLGGGTELLHLGLDDTSEWIRKGILEEHRRRGRFDVQLEVEIAQRFAVRTDHMAHRCIQLARLALTGSPGEPVRRFLSRVGRCYVVGLLPESVVMCRAVLEQAVLEKFQRNRKPLPAANGKSEMRARLRRAEDLGWISRREREDAWQVWLRGSKAVHEDPHLTTDVLGTITTTMSLLSTLYADT